MLFMLPLFLGFIGYVIERVRSRGRPMSPNLIAGLAAFGVPTIDLTAQSLNPAPLFIRIMEFTSGGSVDPWSVGIGLVLAGLMVAGVRAYFRWYNELEELLVPADRTP